MKKVAYILAILVSMATVSLAQETKVFVGFTNVDADNVKGVNLSAQTALYSYEGVKLEAVGDFAALFPEGDYQVYTYLAGPQIGVNLFNKKLNPFARIMFGAVRVQEETVYGHSVGLGADVNVSGPLFFRGAYDRQSFTGTHPIHRTTVGLGLRF